MANHISRAAAVLAAIVLLGLAPVTANASSDAPQGSAPGSQLGSAAVQHAGSQLLVRFRSGTDEAAMAATDRSNGATVLKRFTIVDGLQLVQVDGSPAARNAAMASFAADANVLYAVPNDVLRLADTSKPDVVPNDPSYHNMWNLNNTGQTGGVPDADIDAPEAWNLSTGSRSVVVTLIDTGVQLNHPDLAANIWSNTAECSGTAGVDDDANGYIDDCHGIDTINGDSNPSDDFGHGVHTAGTIGAVGNNSIGVVGVNWLVSVMPCKSHDNTGFATAASVIECLQYAETMKQRGNNVVATSNSYGGCTEACSFDPALYDAIAAHQQDGILFVASAGNDNSNNDTKPVYPATYYLPNVISVAATTASDTRAGFSNFGQRTVDIGAPGESVLSTYLNSTYATLSGTSMAAPHVSGLAALLAAQDPGRDWRAIRNLILTGGDPVSALATNTVTGRRLNAFNALSCSNRTVFAVLRPLKSVVGGQPTTIAALNINCAVPAGRLKVSVSPGQVRLKPRDDGQGADLAQGDGIYSTTWTPPTVTQNTTFTLRFSNGSSTTVIVTP